MLRKIFRFASFAFIVAGCSIGSTPAPITSVPSPSLAIAPATRAPDVTPTLSAAGMITLTVWTTEDFAPGASVPGTIWRDQFAAFRSANPNMGLDIVLKKPDGKGGMLDSLLTTRAVAPALLPDVVILNASDIPVAADKKIFQPLDGIVSDELKEDRFPFAAQSSTDHNQWIAIPFAADVQQMVYNQATVSIAPRAWEDIPRQKTTLVLPLGSDDTFLLQYFALDASLNNFDPQAATQVFAFVKRGREMGFLPEAALIAKNADDAWAAFAASRTVMAQVRASRYLSDRSTLPANLNVWFAPVPTRDGRIATTATAWAFGIVTSDSARANAAAAWIQWLMKTERLAPYLRAAHLLPTTRRMIAMMIEPREYASFLREMLERATLVVVSALYTKKAEAWRAGMMAVWRGEITPEQAARNVAGAK